MRNFTTSVQSPVTKKSSTISGIYNEGFWHSKSRWRRYYHYCEQTQKGDRDQKAETFAVISGMHQGENEIKFKLSWRTPVMEFIAWVVDFYSQGPCA